MGKFEKLTDDDIQFIKDTHSDKTKEWDERMDILSKRFGVVERTVRRWIAKLGISKPEQEIEEVEQFIKAKKKKLKKSKYYLITWAQNNTALHKEFYKNLLAYKDFLNAELLVVAGMYRNPTSLKADSLLKLKEAKKAISWDIEEDYLDANRHNVHKFLMVASDIRVQPTAYNPLSSFEGISGLESCIIGHPKQHLQTLPVLEGHPHKILMSTGSCTVPNYTQTKAGAKGVFDHVIGAVIIEVRDEETFHPRNINADDVTGEFNDLCHNVKDGVVTMNTSLEGIVLGDLHVGSHSESVMDTTFNLMSVIKPKKVILHDVFDGFSISHHHEKLPFLKFLKLKNGDNDLMSEIDYTLNYLEKFSEFEDVVLVRSNHDYHLDRYLNERDWKKDIHNSLAYMKLAIPLLEGKASKGIFQYLVDERYPEYTCLYEGESYMVKGIETGMHGDKGANGARGSSTGFRKLSVKTITGHSHSPNINGGSYVVGTSTNLRLEYNKGLSSWMNAHVTIDDLGKRQLILLINGEFTTFKDFE